jgi:hypothetical protein
MQAEDFIARFPNISPQYKEKVANAEGVLVIFDGSQDTEAAFERAREHAQRMRWNVSGYLCLGVSAKGSGIVPWVQREHKLIFFDNPDSGLYRFVQENYREGVFQAAIFVCSSQVPFPEVFYEFLTISRYVEGCSLWVSSFVRKDDVTRYDNWVDAGAICTTIFDAPKEYFTYPFTAVLQPLGFYMSSIRDVILTVPAASLPHYASNHL